MVKMEKNKINIILVFLLFIPLFIHSDEKKTFDLSEIIDLALENNPLLSAKKSEVEARKASYEASKRLSNPELELNIGKAKAFDEDFERNTGGIALSQHVENPFKRHHRLQIFEKDWEAALFSHGNLSLELIFTIKNLYFDILRLKSIQDLAQKNLDSIQKIYRLIQKRAQLGEIKELEAIKLLVESLLAQRELNQVQTDLLLAKEKLNQYLGNLLPPDFSTAGTLSYAQTGFAESAAIQKALQVHPLLKEKETRLEQANSNWSYVKWQRFPDFKLSGFSQNELDGRNTGIGISLDIPLWSFKSKEIREAEYLSRMEEEELRALRMEIAAEVKAGIHRLKLSEHSLQIFHQGLLKQAEESLKIAEVSYTQGEISLIDYLDSQRTYFSILNDYQDSLYRWNADKAALEKAIGEEVK
jgi:cobalt-zinc-cadmium efflux system outer membrane protein